MTKKNLILALSILSILAVSAGTTTALAAGSNGPWHGRASIPGNQNLTEAQKAELPAKREAIKDALTAGDYNAWVKAETALNPNSPLLQQLTAANFSDYAAKFKDRAAKQADRQAKLTAVRTALKNNDYNAWVTAETALNSDSPLLQKITAANFSQYAQAYQLSDQAHSIMLSLGLTNNIESKFMGEFMDGAGFGPGLRGHQGIGRGLLKTR
ncbi:MAG: hypothetical protein WC453_00735 [Patescibacteria group bacterium]